MISASVNQSLIIPVIDADILSVDGFDDETIYPASYFSKYENNGGELDSRWMNDGLYPYNDTTATSTGVTDPKNCTEQISLLFDLNRASAPSQIIVPVIYGIICLVGLVGNGLVMFVICCSKEMSKSVANIYILNLAVADALFLVSLPFTSTQRVILSWPFGAGMCKIVEAVKSLNYFASIFFLTAMSIDRYFAVVHVVTSGRWRTSRNTFFVCVVIWMISLVMVVPLLIYTRVHGDVCALVFNSQESTWVETFGQDEIPYDGQGVTFSNYGFEDCDKIAFLNDYSNFEPIYDGKGEMSGSYDFKSFIEELEYSVGRNESDEAIVLCKHPDSQTFHVYLVFTFVIGFLMPFSIISVCYIMIILRLTRNSDSRTRSKQAERTRRKVTRMVVALVITFFICWLPFYVWHLIKIKGVKTSIGVCHNVRDFTFCLGYANSCLNPLLYTFLGHKFHEKLRKSIDISLRSLSFTTLYKQTNMSRPESGLHSRRMDVSHTENTDQQLNVAAKVTPLLRQKEDKTTNSSNAKLPKHEEV